MEQVGSKIERVVVYHEGARVRRTVELSWTNKAPFAIEIIDLPLSLDDATVRVRVERVTAADGDNTPAVIDASHVRVGLYVPPAPEVGQVPDRRMLLKALLAIEQNEDAQDQIKTEIALLQSIPVPARPEGEAGKPSPASPMSSRLALEQILDASTASRTKELRALEDQRRDLEREADTLKRTLEAASTAREFKPHELRKAVVVELLARKGNATGVTLSLEYHVGGARWAPAYQCRMDREGRRAEIVMRAHICQLTGEDWSGVALTLSTASPMSWTELPEPTAIKIGKAQVAPPRPAPRPPPVGAMSLFQDFDRERSTVASLMPNFPAFGAQPFEITSPPSLHKHVEARAKRESWQGASAISLDAAPKAEPVYADSPFAEITDDDIDNLFNDGEAPAAEGEMQSEMRDAPSQSPAPPPAPYASAAAPVVDAMMGPKKRAKGRDGASADDESTLSIRLYAQLKLAAATSIEGRTRLTAIGMRESYAESLDRRGRVVRFEDAARKIAAVKAGEARVLEMSLPSGACDVRASAAHFDYAYTTDVKVDVPSDGMFHSIPVGVRQAEADMRYVVVPREDTSVFRQANITNPLNSPLLQGPRRDLRRR